MSMPKMVFIYFLPENGVSIFDFENQDELNEDIDNT